MTDLAETKWKIKTDVECGIYEDLTTSNQTNKFNEEYEGLVNLATWKWEKNRWETKSFDRLDYMDWKKIVEKCVIGNIWNYDRLNCVEPKQIKTHEKFKNFGDFTGSFPKN